MLDSSFLSEYGIIFSHRAVRCLAECGVTNLESFLRLKPSEFQDHFGVGAGTFREVSRARTLLADAGMPSDQWERDEEVGPSLSAKIVLYELGYRVTDDLSDLSLEDLKAVPRCGPKVVKEVLAMKHRQEPIVSIPNWSTHEKALAYRAIRLRLAPRTLKLLDKDGITDLDSFLEFQMSLAYDRPKYGPRAYDDLNHILIAAKKAICSNQHIRQEDFIAALPIRKEFWRDPAERKSRLY